MCSNRQCSEVMSRIPDLLLCLTVLWCCCCICDVHAQSSGRSVCSTLAFRRLTAQLQNEHQCMVLEQVHQQMEDEKLRRDNQYNDVINALQKMETRMKEKLGEDTKVKKPDVPYPALKDIPMSRDCYELFQNGITVSGIYPIKLSNDAILNVWCDMDSDGGGWTVIQRRQDGSINFTRNWDDYTLGFGNANTEYWFGNRNIHSMTSTVDYTLKIELQDWELHTAIAYYDEFKVSSEEDAFRLHIDGYHGTAGDALNVYHNEIKFSTHDKDNDVWYGSCAQKDRSGWWFRACAYSSLNGVYHRGGRSKLAPDGVVTGISWYHWKNDYAYSMKRTEMKLKPKTAIHVEAEMEQYKKEMQVKKWFLNAASTKATTTDMVTTVEGSGIYSYTTESYPSNTGQSPAQKRRQKHDGQERKKNRKKIG